MPRFKLTSWNGTFDYFNNGNIDFGLWQECYRCCKEYGYPFNVINKEEFPRNNKITRGWQVVCYPLVREHALQYDYDLFKPAPIP